MYSVLRTPFSRLEVSSSLGVLIGRTGFIAQGIMSSLNADANQFFVYLRRPEQANLPVDQISTSLVSVYVYLVHTSTTLIV